MSSPFYLTVLIGPAIPIPPPKDVTDALTSVQVTSGSDRSGFQLSFAVSKRSLLSTTLLPAGYFDPMITRVIIVVTLDGIPRVLMDGIVTRQEMQPSNDPGQSVLTITGEDLSVLMDVIEIPRPFPALDDIARVYAVLAPYAAFGIAPLAIPPFVTYFEEPTKGWPSQLVTDRAYLKSLADDCGYVFYVEPGPLPGASIAYFGPDVRIPIPQPALTVNMDAHTNVESLSFSLDGLAKKILVAIILDPVTKRIPIPIPFPNLNALRPPLGARLTPPAKVEFLSDMSELEPAEAAKQIIGKSFSSQQAVSGSGSLDVLRYGHVLRSRMLVGVRGAGLGYDGMYYVDSVTHNIKRGEYKQNFTLSRDGLISNTPRVLP
jgi:hypothetical protein